MGRICRAVGLLLVCAAPVAAQNGSIIRGVVSGRDGVALGYAVVIRQSFPADTLRADSVGRFAITGLARGTHAIRFQHIGYDASDVELEFHRDTSITMDIRLGPLAATLEPIEVRSLADLAPFERKLASVGFAERRELAGRTATDATFITPDEINRRHAARICNLLEGQRSVRMRYNQSRCVPVGRDGRCVMSVWLDGQLVYPPAGARSGGGLSGLSVRGNAVASGQSAEGVEFISVNSIAAIEIYPSPSGTPPQFQSLSGTCGAIIVWTRQ